MRALGGVWLRYAVPVAVLLVVIGGGGLAAVESDTVESFGQGVWWALSLMTTVGFVGNEPITTAGRVISGVLMVLGFAMITFTTAAIASLFVRESEEPEERALRRFEERSLHELEELKKRLAAIEERLDRR
jgi:voltage-gated potassium channel